MTRQGSWQYPAFARNLLGNVTIMFAVLAMGGIAQARPFPQDAPDFKDFLRKNCFDCHEGSESEASLDLSQISYELTDQETFDRWVRVYDRVERGEMPPPDASQPRKSTRRHFLATLDASLLHVDRLRTKAWGRVRARRLNRIEYENTVRQLLGIDIPLQHWLPEDARVQGFETVAEGQQISQHLLAKYLEAADAALDEATRRAASDDTYPVRKFGVRDIGNRRVASRQPQPLGDEVVSWSAAQPFHGRIPKTTVRESGWYRVSVRARGVNAPEGRGVWTSVRSGVCFARAPLMYWVGAFEAGTEPATHEFVAWIEQGHMLEVRPADATLRRLNFQQVSRGGKLSEGVPGVAITWIQMERIHTAGTAAQTRRILFGTLDPQQLDSTLPEGLVAWDEIESPLRHFARRAFRRPVEDGELAPYLEFVKSVLADGSTVRDGLRAGYRALLCSPRFLYFQEKPGPLDDHAIASRLSYLLWSSMPDQELSRLADQGKLRQADTYAAQVQRLLNDARAEAFYRDFTDQWLNLREIEFTTPDQRLYREFDQILQWSMLQETRSYLKELVHHDLSVTHLVDSDFTMLNERLARHYGIPGVQGEQMRRVALQPADQRGGVMTHASVMKVTANGTTTSPIVRGVWVMEKLLGEEAPPPPANVPAIEPDIRGAKTIREQLAKHRSQQECAVCHAKIDPPGFALEAYDVIGGYRERYRVSGRGPRKGPKVDTSYQMADGRQFADTRQFKDILLAEPEKLARSFAAQVAVYGTGATLTYADRRILEQIVQASKDSRFGVRTLIEKVVSSPIFLQK